MVICSICAANDLPKAATLAASIKATQQDAITVLCLVERTSLAASSFASYFSEIILPSDLNLSDLDVVLFRHTVYEACCVLKPDLLLWAIAKYTNETIFVFMDSDTVSYGAFEECEVLESKSNILVTPHHVSDHFHIAETYDIVLRTLSTGIFNAGFLAVSRGKDAVSFLEWWSARTHLLCVPDVSSSLYCDQRWLDLALSFFDMSILRHPGYNVAHWNIAKRPLSYVPSHKTYFVAGFPLKTFHFSLASEGKDMYYFHKYCSSSSVVFTLRAEYIDSLRRLDIESFARLEWSYGTYTSGEPISPQVRSLFHPGSPLYFSQIEPFSKSNAFLYKEAGSALRAMS